MTIVNHDPIDGIDAIKSGLQYQSRFRIWATNSANSAELYSKNRQLDFLNFAQA
jgi:hypothetical protein